MKVTNGPSLELLAKDRIGAVFVQEQVATRLYGEVNSVPPSLNWLEESLPYRCSLQLMAVQQARQPWAVRPGVSHNQLAGCSTPCGGPRRCATYSREGACLSCRDGRHQASTSQTIP